jgi:hypothetical protein
MRRGADRTDARIECSELEDDLVDESDAFRRD